MKNKILIKQKTIVIPIGSTNCGKTYFCKERLIPFLNSHNINFKYINSNDEQLESELDNYTQYPVNTDVVIVDGMNITKESRDIIFKYAVKNNYRVVGILFNFKLKDDYFKYGYEENSFVRKQIFQTLKYFRSTTLTEVKRNDFDELYTIKSIDFDNYIFAYEESNYIKPNTNLFKNYCIIGDIHGCLDELIEAVVDNKGLIYNQENGSLEINEQEKYHHHILVGDYIDKGPKVKETIEFLYNNRPFFWIAKANHESWVYKFLKGELGSFKENEDIINSHFNTVYLLKDNEELTNMFFTLYESSFDYIEAENFIVTHAPCDVKYLGKNDDESIKFQKNIRYPKRNEYESEAEYLNAKEKFFIFLIDQANIEHKVHFFGHLMTKEVFNYLNKYNIDTGCVIGNKLTTALINCLGKTPIIKSYKSQQPNNKELSYMFNFISETFEYSLLKFQIQNDLYVKFGNKLNYISKEKIHKYEKIFETEPYCKVNFEDLTIEISHPHNKNNFINDYDKIETKTTIELLKEIDCFCSSAIQQNNNCYITF